MVVPIDVRGLDPEDDDVGLDLEGLFYDILGHLFMDVGPHLALERHDEDDRDVFTHGVAAFGHVVGQGARSPEEDGEWATDKERYRVTMVRSHLGTP